MTAITDIFRGSVPSSSSVDPTLIRCWINERLRAMMSKAERMRVRIRVRPKGEKQIDEPSTWWTESRLSYLMRQGDAQAVIWSKIRRLSSRSPLGLPMVPLDVSHQLPGDLCPLWPLMPSIYPDLSREHIILCRFALPEKEGLSTLV